MNYRSYHKEIQKVTAQFLDLFDGIIIDRRTPANVVQKTFKVPCLYESRSRILKSIENRSNTLPLPIICSSIQSISRDSRRAFNIHDELALKNIAGDSFNYLKKTPIPIDIRYELSIIAKFQEDVEQIIGNFVPHFIADLYIVIPQPNSSADKLKCQVVWDGNFSTDYPVDIDKNTPSRVIYTTNFTVKAWMFAGLDNAEVLGHYIKRINFNPCIQWESGIGRLSNWHAVPNTMSFTEYKNNVICGYIHRDYYDELQISGRLSGYWQDISGLCTGMILDQELTGNPCYLSVSGGLLIISNQGYVNRAVASIGLLGYDSYWKSTLTGELSGYRQCSG